MPAQTISYVRKRTYKRGGVAHAGCRHANGPGPSMKPKHSPTRRRAGFFLCARAVNGFAAASTAAYAQSTAPPPSCTSAVPGAAPLYCINWSALTNGSIQRAHNGCYLLAASIGQVSPAPGFAYSQTGSSGYAVFSGFWAAAQVTDVDEIFFNGFEGCGP